MVIGFMVVTDLPRKDDPDGVLNSHGFVRQVRVCECPKVVRRFGPDEEAVARSFAATVNHSVVLPVRDR